MELTTKEALLLLLARKDALDNDRAGVEQYMMRWRWLVEAVELLLREELARAK